MSTNIVTMSTTSCVLQSILNNGHLLSLLGEQNNQTTITAGQKLQLGIRRENSKNWTFLVHEGRNVHALCRCCTLFAIVVLHERYIVVIEVSFLTEHRRSLKIPWLIGCKNHELCALCRAQSTNLLGRILSINVVVGVSYH